MYWVMAGAVGRGIGTRDSRYTLIKGGVPSCPGNPNPTEPETAKDRCTYLYLSVPFVPLGYLNMRHA
jgi:hypothetical protein